MVASAATARCYTTEHSYCGDEDGVLLTVLATKFASTLATMSSSALVSSDSFFFRLAIFVFSSEYLREKNNSIAQTILGGGTC